ncbi:MAG TPA: DUF423 domain-containing protein [Bryobacteraceae bacterium]|jgi:uncharacterized membrane protein YgdD (TMEM256/DUF423 family)|nr:DUF423 domain-containing protein [Bryobacteraceae bacterium]
MNWTAAGAVLMLLGVACGAFGAHALKARLDPAMMDVYHTAVQYHLIHALGILIVAALLRSGAITAAGGSRVAWFLLSGIILFSGSLYALALSGVRTLGAITPVGGLAFIVGWLLLIYEALANRS